MLYLKKSLLAWQSHDFSDDFNVVLKNEIASLNARLLPLQQGLRHSSYALSDKLSSTILSVANEKEAILIKVGLFYTGMISGCNCADDPSPSDDEYNEYCDVLFSINKKTAATTVVLID